jgi:acyl-CoA synthetase (AMP-forming)/AMP-acid ligase II
LFLAANLNGGRLASPIPLPVLRDATKIIGCSFLQSYGLTESTGGFTLLGPADHVPEEKFEHRLRSAGRPMAASPVRVVDPVTLADCPVGERVRCWCPRRAS